MPPVLPAFPTICSEPDLAERCSPQKVKVVSIAGGEDSEGVTYNVCLLSPPSVPPLAPFPLPYPLAWPSFPFVLCYPLPPVSLPLSGYQIVCVRTRS